MFIDRPDNEIVKEDVAQLKQEMFRTPLEAGYEILDVIPLEFFVDKHTRVNNPVGMSGQHLEGIFYIITGLSTSAKNIRRCVERSGIKLNGLILEPLASANAVLTDEEKEIGVALVDIGGGTTDVAVFNEQRLCHTAVIPYGGDVITKDIQKAFGLIYKNAESLKKQYGCALAQKANPNILITVQGVAGREPTEVPHKVLANVIQARMEEIIDTVLYEIKQSGIQDFPGMGIVLTGGGAMLKFVEALFKDRAGCYVKVSSPESCLLQGSNATVSNPIFATGVGLLIEGNKIEEKQAKTEEIKEEVIVEEEKTITPEPETKMEAPEVQDEYDDDIEEDEEEAHFSEKAEGSFFGKIKKTIWNILDERDTKL